MAAPLIAGSLLASCSSVKPHPTVDPTSAAEQISSQLASRYSIPSPVVSCPAGVPDTEGQTFVCTATLDGQSVDLQGTVTGSGGRFSVMPKSAILGLASLTAQLASQIESRTGSKPIVDCGTRNLLVVPAGKSFTCQAKFAGQQPRVVTVKIADVQGDFGYSLGPGH